MLSRDCIIDAQIQSLTNTDGWAKAGVMIRESLEPDARNVFAFLTPVQGMAAQARANPGGTTSFDPGPWWVAPPHWVRLERRGSRIFASSSADGVTWDEIATYDAGWATTFYVGFVVTSHQPAALATAVFNEPSIC